MHMFTFEALPKPESTHADTHGGAYVNALIDFQDPWGAEQLARLYIDDAGWIPEGNGQATKISREDCDHSEQSLSYFRQAEEKGCCLVFKAWPIEAEQDEGNSEEGIDQPSLPTERSSSQG